jgi:hypothetical protein
MQAAGRRHGLAAVGSALALMTGAAALAPEASASSGATHACANKVVTLELEGEPGVKTPFKLTIKAISTQGVSCGAAYKFIGLLETNHLTTTPEHYKCKLGHFKVPAGLVPQVCTRPGARIQYAQQGG